MMSLSAFFIALFALLVVAVNVDGQDLCSSIPRMANFDPKKAGGQWFVQYIGAHNTNVPLIKCEIRTLTPIDNGTYIEVHVIFLENDEDAESVDNNMILQPHDDNPANLEVLYSPINNTQIVVDTDYQNYAIWVDCFQLGSETAYTTVVMTNDRQRSTDTDNLILNSLNNNKLNDGSLLIMAQGDCKKSSFK